MVVWAGAEAQRGERRASAWRGQAQAQARLGSGARCTGDGRLETQTHACASSTASRVRAGAARSTSSRTRPPAHLVWWPYPLGVGDLDLGVSLRFETVRAVLALWLARARGLRRARAGELMRLRHVMPLHPTYCGSLPLPALYGSTYATACTRARLPLYSLRMTLCISSYLRAIRITIDSKLESGSIYIHF